MTRTASLFLILFAGIGLLRGEDALLDGAWMQRRIKWASAPPDINPRLQTGEASVLYFKRDRTFSLVYCTINRVESEYLTISHGDGQVIYQGEWTQDHANVTVTYRLVHRTVAIIGENLPGPVNRGQILRSGPCLLFKGQTYCRSAALDRSVAEVVEGVPQASHPQPK
jgi:hypothetical protein